MYQSTAAYEKLIQQSSRTFPVRIVIDGKHAVTEGVKSIKHNMASMAGDVFTIGSTVSQYVEIRMAVTNIPIENQTVTVSEGMHVGGTIEYIPMGIYTAERPKADEETVSFTAYDNMMHLECAYASKLPKTTNTIEVLKEIASISKVPIITAGLKSYPMKKPSGCTCRELLGMVAQMYGCFAICNRDGSISIRWYEDKGYRVPINRYWGTFTHSDFPYEFHRIVCATGKGEDGKSTVIESGRGVREMQISNPYMTQTVLNEVALKLNGFVFMPGSIKFLGDNRLDPWDVLTVEDRNGKSYKVPCMKLTHDWDGGLVTEVQAAVESEAEQEYNYKGPTTQTLARFDIELAIIKEEYVLNSNIVNANIESLNATTAQIKNLLAGSVTSGDIQTIVLNAMNTTIADATIKSAMIENLQFDKITGFEVNTSRVNVGSQDGKSSWSDNTIQISDSSRVRVQLGKDASGDYSIYIWGKDGKLMFDPLGLAADGISRPIIRDDMVADDAQINGKKVDITSLAKEIDDSGVTLKSTVIRFDTTGQTLDFTFNTLKTFVDGSIQDQTTMLNVMQGKVSGLISENSQIKGEVGTIRTQYNAFVTTVSGMEITIADHTSKLNQQSGAISETETKLANYKTTLDGFSATVSQIKVNLGEKSANYVGAYAPTMSYSPASGWNTTTLREEHLGDIFFNTSTGDLFAFSKSGTTYAWTKQDRVTTSQMTSAINTKAGEITASVSSSYATKSDMSSANSKIGNLETWKNTASLKITDSAIISTVTGSSSFKTLLSSQIKQEMDKITITAGKIKLEGLVTANGTFKILSNGSLECIGGKLGGFTITASKIYGTSTAGETVVMQKGTGGSGTAFAAGVSGPSSYGDCPFRVRMDGRLYAKDAVIEGTVKCGSSTGYWTKLGANGKLTGGYGSTQYGYVDYSASVYNMATGATRNGIQIQGGCLRISVSEMATRKTSNVGTVAYIGATGTLEYISRIVDNGDGSITWHPSSISFENGLMVSSL